MEIDRRAFLIQMAAIGLQASACASALGVVQEFAYKVATKSEVESAPEDIYRAGIVLINGASSIGAIKHIVYDNHFMGTPHCFLNSEIESALARFERNHPWKTLMLCDEALYAQIGEIPPGGKELAKECFTPVAEWTARALRTAWPLAHRIDDSMEYLEKSETHVLFRKDGDTLWAVPWTPNDSVAGASA